MRLANTTFFAEDTVQMKGNIFDSTRVTGRELATLEIGECITVHFESPEALINFCQQHNIECKDQRNEKA